VDPALVRTPRHKWKVERSIFLPRQQVLAGRIFAHIEEANEYALQWCRHQIRRCIKNPPKSAVATFLGKKGSFLDKVREFDECEGWYGNYV